jgi:hypothetical protein
LAKHHVASLLPIHDVARLLEHSDQLATRDYGKPSQCPRPR